MRPLELSQTISAQASPDFSGLTARLLSRVRVQRTLMDCPEFTFSFRPFLLPSSPGDNDDYILAPLRPDTAPMAHMISAFFE